MPTLEVAGPGKRRASKHSGSRGPLFRGLPSLPVLFGIAALGISAAGAVHAAGPGLVTDQTFAAAGAFGGDTGQGTTNLLEGRSETVSRDSQRDDENAELLAQAEAQEQQRNAALARFAKQAEARAARIALNLWQYPTDPVELTARFGEYGLWSSYHTGLDFNGNTGDPIYAVASGVVTSVGYDGSYGNKTVVTLDDGTEIWYCHQNTFNVSEGETVEGGELIGTIGATGNVTGSHLHLEVRPGGGDPVDPYAAMVVHGLFG